MMIPRRAFARARAALLLATAACAASAGCGGGGAKPPISLSVDLSLEQMSCAFSTCTETVDCVGALTCPAACPMSCGGKVVITAVDVTSATEPVLQSRCVSWPVVEGQTLLDLPELIRMGSVDAGALLDMGLTAGRRIALRVSVFSPPPVEDCPAVHVDPDFGFPITDQFESPIYFGQSVAFTLEAGRSSVEVPISCYGSTSVCSTSSTTTIDATVHDTNAGLFIPPLQPEAIDLHYGSVTADPMTGHAHFFPRVGLEFLPNPSPHWFKELPDGQADWDYHCSPTATTRIGSGSTVSTVSCEAGVNVDFTLIQPQGYFVPKEQLDQVLAALGLTAFPDGGLLIGRVVDAGLSPTAGATVTAQTDPNINVIYLDMQGGVLVKKGGTGAGPTAMDGWFVITDPVRMDGEAIWGMTPGTQVRCCDYLQADRIADGAMGISAMPTGLIDGVVTSTIITLNQ